MPRQIEDLGPFRPEMHRSPGRAQEAHPEEYDREDAQGQAKNEREEPRPGHPEAPEGDLESFEADPDTQEQEDDGDRTGLGSLPCSPNHAVAPSQYR